MISTKLAFQITQIGKLLAITFLKIKTIAVFYVLIQSASIISFNSHNNPVILAPFY